MKKTTITISYDEEQLSALKLYLEQKNTNIENELCKALDALYQKTVPAGVRDFIGMRSGKEAQTAAPRVRKPKPSPSSAVGAEIKSEVNADERH